MAVNFIDTDIQPLNNTVDTPEGYLAAEAFSVRSGIQFYRGTEVGLPDKDVVKVYRPPEEVFAKDSVATFAHKPVTVDHPKGGVTADNWRGLAVGEVSTEAMRDGERLKLQLVVKDAAAIRLVKAGAKRQLSAGYSCELDHTPGVTPSGEAYDAVQRDIRINHLALVERGRAGNCMIGDSDWGVKPLSDTEGASPRNKEVQMDIAHISLGDTVVKVVTEDEKKIKDHIAKLTADNATAVSALTADNEKLKGEKAVLEQKLRDAEMTPEKLQQLVADRAQVAAGYKALTGKDAEPLMSTLDVKKDAVKAKLGDAAKDMSDAAIEGAFAALTLSAKPTDTLRNAVTDCGIHPQGVMADTDTILAASGLKLKKEA